MVTLLRDLRYSARSLSRSPAFTAALLLTVALGIGSYATIAAFTGGWQRDFVAAGSGEGEFKLARLTTILSWTVALVFVTASANVAGLLLSRASRRRHETASRAALGATRGRLALHVLADSLAVAIGGGLLGLLVAYWTATAFPALLYSEDAERLQMTSALGPAFKATGAYTITMLICAMAPIWELRRHSPMAVLRRTGDGATTAVGSLRSALVTAQIAACVFLVIGSGVLLEGFRTAVRTVRAQQIGQPIVAFLQAPGGFGRPDIGRDYLERAEKAVLRIPGITGVAWTSTLPGVRPTAIDVRFEPAAEGFSDAVVDTSTPEGYRLAGLRVKAGRMFGGMDTAASCPVVVVNEAAEKKYFAGDALGRALLDGAGRRVDVIGVATRDRKEPLFYFYAAQHPDWASDEIVERRFRLPLNTAAAARTAGTIDVTIASPRYFDTLGGSLAAGKGIRDALASDCDVALVNREAADRWFGGRAPGGAIVDSDGRRATIVGVVDAPVLRVIERTAAPMVYYPATQRYVPGMILIAQAAQATPELVAGIDKELRAVTGTSRLPQVMTLEQRLVQTALGPERIAAVLVAVCAVLALSLGLVGVYAVMADAVRQRQREIALRLALGAPASHIVVGVFREGVRFAARGGAIGLGISWALVQFLHHSDDQFAQVPVWAWLLCPAVLLAIVTAASVLPAKWALAVNPLTITRES